MHNLKIILTISFLTVATAFTAEARDAKNEKITQYKDRIVSFRSENIQLINPIARKAQKGQNSAAFVTVINTSSNDQKIISATSPVAAIIELHTSSEKDGIYRMRPVDTIDIPAGGMEVLKSGGYHIMLIDLHHDLMSDQEIPVTFEMDNGNKIDATYKVQGCGCGCKSKKKP